jgi:hypothetical protein
LLDGMADTSTDAIRQVVVIFGGKTAPELTLLTFSRSIPAKMVDG